MYTFLAALKDLWDFIWGMDQRPAEKKSEPEIFLIAPPLDLVKLPSTQTQVVESKELKPTVVNSLPTKVPNDFGGEKHFITADPGLVLNRPVLSYDGVLVKLPYATMTKVLAYEGRFARIALGESTGWILKDDLTQKASEIFPEFISGTVYTEDDSETQKLRKYIEDEFFTKELFLPLQSAEFVTYQLKKHNLKIDWPEIRPRLAGVWQNILKGKNGIHIGLTPKTGAIIEYSNDDGTGFVGYTKSVKVDESIIIEGVGRQKDGEYREELIEKSEWQNWRAVWISVS